MIEFQREVRILSIRKEKKKAGYESKKGLENELDGK